MAARGKWSSGRPPLRQHLLAQLALQIACFLQRLACLERLPGIHAFTSDIDALAGAILRGTGGIGAGDTNGEQENSDLFKHFLPFD